MFHVKQSNRLEKAVHANKALERVLENGCF